MDCSASAKRSKRPPSCFIQEDSGLASLAAESKPPSFPCNKNNHMALHRKRSSSLSSIASLHALPSPRFCFDARIDNPQQPHFLDACFLCNKPLVDRDIFMYRGDTPFCSEECRQEQMEIDEAKEKSWKISASVKALRKKDQRRSTSPNRTSQNCTFRTSTVAAA